MATFALVEGGLGKPGKLFSRSLRIPTENALAQAQWAEATHNAVSVPNLAVDGMRIPASEALALRSRANKKWTEVIEACRAWSCMEPTSTRPLIMGTYVAEVALEDGKLAREFAERALVLAPNESWAHNNLAVALAYLGELDGARKHASRFELHEIPEESKPFYFATKGLIAYRSGDAEAGRRLYLQGAHLDGVKKNPEVLAQLLWHLVREEFRVHAPGVEEVAEELALQTRNIAIPELDELKSRLPHIADSPQRKEVQESIAKELPDLLLRLPSVKGGERISRRDSISRQLEEYFASRGRDK